jgi:PPOX class probable F420-dependent enzyme
MDLEPFRALIAADSGLVVVSIARPDATVHASVVNAGVLAHPGTGAQVVGFVVMGGARKLTMLRERPQVTVTVRAGWQWSTVEGRAQLIGPDDPADGFDAERIRVLLRDIFTAAGGTHDDWDTYDRVMREERRAAVLVDPTRLYPQGGR